MNLKKTISTFKIDLEDTTLLILMNRATDKDSWAQ